MSNFANSEHHTEKHVNLFSTKTQNGMREIMLIFHLIGLVMALGAGFANFFLGTVASKLEPSERGNFMAKTMILGRMSQIGLALLLLSGFYLIRPYGRTIGEMPCSWQSSASWWSC